MFRSLRYKILSGYFFIALLLLAFCIYATYHLGHLHRSIDKVFEENYKSIIYTTQMIELSERMDSDLLSAFSRHKEAPTEFETHKNKLIDYLALADSNVTILGEKLLINNIRDDIQQYIQTSNRFYSIQDDEQKFHIYTQEIQPIFQILKEHIYELLNLNQSRMYDFEKSSQDKAERIIIAGIVTSIITLFLSVFLGWSIGYSISNPIRKVIRFMQSGKKDYDKENLPQETGCYEIDQLIKIVKEGSNNS